MDRTRAVTIGLGGWLILMGIAAPPIAGGVFTGNAEEFFFGVCFFFVFVLIGVVVLIVGISRSDRRLNQQQQQQIVVMAGPGYGAPAAPSGPRLRCPKCHTLNPTGARFCKQCGVHFGGTPA